MYKKNLLLLALFAGLISLASFGYWHNQHPQRLYQQYKPNPAQIAANYSNRAVANSQSLPFFSPEQQQAVAFSCQGEFYKALGLLEQAGAAESEDARAIFLLGLNLLLAEQADEARAYLHRCSQMDSPLQSEARWYLALLELKAGNSAAAKNLLLPVTQDISLVQKQSIELFQQL